MKVDGRRTNSIRKEREEMVKTGNNGDERTFYMRDRPSEWARPHLQLEIAEGK